MSHPGQRILDIPNEHLAEIFRLAIGDPSHRGKTRTVLQLVCKRWSRVMVNSKFLWSKITLEVQDPLEAHWISKLGWGKPRRLDLSYIAQCLRIAHGHPLDITIRIANTPSGSCWHIIAEALELLRSHSIRLRSLSCRAPMWFFVKEEINFTGLLDPDYLPRLETLSLFVQPREIFSAQVLPRLVADEVGLSRSLRHLNLNFPFHHFDVAWANITSFAGGFDDHSHFFDVLPRMVALESLHLMYIKPLGTAVPEPCITLEALRHLKLSSCAAFAMALMKDKLRLPGVKELSLLPTEEHLHRSTEACPFRILSADVADSLCTMFERSGAPISSLNVVVEPSTPTDVLRRLCEMLGSAVQSLQLTLEWGNRTRDVAAIFDMLTPAAHNSVVLLPKMTSLEVIGKNQKYIFEGPVLEELVTLRWEEGKRSSRLQKLRLRRLRYLHDCDAPRGDSLAGSSLALTLWKYRAAGLDVQWMDEGVHEPRYEYIPGDVDVLSDTQEYIPTMQRE